MAEKKDSKGRVLRTGESQYKDGRYCYRYRLDGKTKAVYDWDLAKLREKEKQIQRDLENGIDASLANKMTLNDCFDKYMATKVRLRESTVTNYKYMYDRYVRDDFGKRAVGKIKFSDLQKLYNDLLDGTLQFGTLRLLHNALNPTFELAVRDNIIAKNPAKDLLKELRNSHETKQEKRFALTEKEQAAFMEYVRNSIIYERYLPLFTVFLGTGLRVGECLGLTWNDVDFKNNVIHVNKTLIYKGRENGKTEFFINPTKTGCGTRTIPMLKEVRKAFLTEKEKQMENGPCESVIDGYSGFVFSNIRNHAHKPNTINRVIDSIVNNYNKEEAELAKKEKREAFQIRHFSVHNFRHTFATRYCQIETNLKTIQEIMGHSDISVTMKIYAEATEESKAKSFESMEGKFKIG